MLLVWKQRRHLIVFLSIVYLTCASGIDTNSSSTGDVLRETTESISDATINNWTPGLPDGRLEPTTEEHRDVNVDAVEYINTESIKIARNSYPDRIWTNRENDIATVPIYIRRSIFGEEYGFNEATYNLILESLDHITSESHAVQFRPWKSGDEDYIIFKKASSGCSSTIGSYGGYQDIWLASWCFYKGNIHHEALHALGFGHEMNRPDRDQYVTIKTANIKSDWLSQFDKSSSADSLGAPYDYLSVMHYSAYAASRNGRITIDAGEYTNVIGQRDSISAGDILQLKLMYQCTSGPRTYTAMNTYGACNNNCKCDEGQAGCGTNDDACRGSLICHDNTCKTEGTSITSSKTIYDGGESIQLSFQNPSSSRAWISIQPANTDPQNIVSSSEAWSWVCGSTSCADKTVSSGTFELASVSSGTWRAYLILDMNWPYEAVAYTEAFEVGSVDHVLNVKRIRIPKGSASTTDISFLKTHNDSKAIIFTPNSKKLLANFVFDKIPSSVDPSSIKSIRFEANVLAPPVSENLVIFQIRNYKRRKWQVLGKSKGKVPSEFNVWTRELNSFTSISNFLNPWGSMYVRVITETSAGDIELDSLTLTVSY